MPERRRSENQIQSRLSASGNQNVQVQYYNIQTALGHMDEGIQYEINCLKQESQEINYDSLNTVFELRDSI